MNKQRKLDQSRNEKDKCRVTSTNCGEAKPVLYSHRLIPKYAVCSKTSNLYLFLVMYAFTPNCFVCSYLHVFYTCRYEFYRSFLVLFPLIDLIAEIVLF